MQDDWAGKCGHGNYQWKHLAAVTLVRLLLITISYAILQMQIGCKATSAKDPELTLQQIHKEILRGNLSSAERELALLGNYFPAHCQECNEKLKLTQAELLTSQGRSQEVVTRLCNSTKTELSVDSRIRRDMLCGFAHANVGQQEISSEELQRAQSLAMSNQSGLRPEVLQVSGNVAAHKGRYTEAMKLYQLSSALAHEQSDQVLEASNMLNMGYLALQSEHYGEALDWSKASSKLAASIGAQALLETDLGNAGWAYYKLGDFEVALHSFQQAEEQAKKLGVIHSEVGWRKNAGLCLQHLGDLSGAATNYESALHDAEKIGNKKLIADTHILIAQLLLQEGHLDAAKVQADAAQAQARVSGDKSTELDARFLQGAIAARQGENNEAEQMLTDLYRETEDGPSVRWNVENALASLAARRGAKQEANNWYRKSIATFETQRSAVKDEELRLPFFTNGDELYRDYAEFLADSHKSDKALELLDLGRARTLSEGLGRANDGLDISKKTSFNPQAVARYQDATILFYSLGTDKSRLWVVDGRHTRDFVLPKKAEIEAQVAAYQKAILKSSDPLRANSVEASSLYDSLIGPAAPFIPRNSRVIVISDGGLNSLNFETLVVPGKDGPHYWIDDVTVSNANSIRLLATAKSKESLNVNKRILLVGDPIVQGSDFERLANAPDEIRVVAKQFPENARMVLTQAAAVPPAYINSKPDQYSYIHFVAHGTASQLSPLDSAVVLSPSLEHPDNYKLYARDIVHQPIHAELVTISACYGSGVRSYAGEGLVGLSWAFLRAGSHNVIGALWNVDDASTPQLMGHLYSELRSGSRPDAALRKAKLSMVHSEGVYRKPLYWGAFQLYAGS